ncbi:BEL1-like homeodomain protein 6 [Tripterygium wilfordii]|uniref:BEL1-like homeodomain protein 6 n=1 Tax=Tripterygium wilfordii TaxID=458696 RepID=A0A7J7DHN0_TRIWF|nr:BEL1-like homeodomain protein 7 [Tripterygium wilfordii]KAF5745744.1 BEL1-like homeodomain protein 6 [Tripterygium wilfordii]
MATYYPNANNERDATPMLYLRESLPVSYPEAPILPGNMMMYMSSGSYTDAPTGNPQQSNNFIEMHSVEASNSTAQHQKILPNLGGSRMGEHDFNDWRDGRNEMLVMHSLAAPANLLHDGQNLQGQGLSLSLGTQISSGIQMPSIPYRNPNSGFSPFLGRNPSITGEEGSRNASSREENARNAEYMPTGVPGGSQDSNKGDLTPYGMSNMARTIPGSKYLKAAQELLDEVVNVRKALKQPNREKNQSSHEHGDKSTKEGDGDSKNVASTEESDNLSPSELSHAERQDLQNKLSKLLYMLDEVDRRYKQYFHQMQIVVSSFDVIAGCGAAKPYTALALQTISRHFRCLRDAITGQIKAARKSLGEQDDSENGKGVGIARLRFVDQQLRQQRALQQLGMMQQHTWRPQRGLPESSVSILRAWLFEHFLHPYPKDSDKIMLARQTGLTRSQVSNWFINARVRLWKPMVEEMYKEEIGDAEMDSNSSSENAARATKGDVKNSEDRGGEELQQSASSTATDKCSQGHLIDSKTDNVPDVEMAGSTARIDFQNVMQREVETEYGLLKSRNNQRVAMDDSNIFPDAMVHPHGGSDRFMATAAAAYHMSELGSFGGGSGVSLTLGLQHCEGGSLPMAGGSHHNFVSMRGDNIYGAPASSIGTETTDFECMNTGDRQQRFSSSHFLHDFVA